MYVRMYVCMHFYESMKPQPGREKGDGILSCLSPTHYTGAGPSVCGGLIEARLGRPCFGL